MKKLSYSVLFALLLLACDNTKENVATEPENPELSAMDSLDHDSTGSLESTQVPVDRQGPLYVSDDTEYKFRIISRSDSSKIQKILLRNEVSGRVYSMERVLSPTGEKFQDADGNYIWIRTDDFTFGKKDEVITEGKSEKFLKNQEKEEF